MGKLEITKYTPKIEKWRFDETIIGGKMVIKTYFSTIGLSPFDPADPECIYFNISPTREIFNETQNQHLFFGKVIFTYKIRIGNNPITVDLVFNLMNESMKEFASIYNNKTNNTIINHHEIEVIKLSDHKDAIQDTNGKLEYVQFPEIKI